MATSPTVLASASTSPSPAPAPVPAAPKSPIVPVLLAVVAGALIAALFVGGVVYYLESTGRLPVQGKGVQRTEAVGPTTTHPIPLEPFLVNLAGPGGSSYLRMTLALQVADADDKKGSKDQNSKDHKVPDEFVPAVRDTVLSVLGQQTADGLLAADGKEHLKAELKTALAKHNTDLKVMDVFFTDFLVQR
jgi:flagellar protein FliL